MRRLLNVDSESVLKRLDQILDKEVIVAHTVSGAPLTKEEYNKRLAEAERQIDSGEHMTQEELEHESKDW